MSFRKEPNQELQPNKNPKIKISELVIKNKEKILKNWEVRAKKEVAAAQGLEPLALQNALPQFLTKISEALSVDIMRTDLRRQFDLEENTRIGKQHGGERAVIENYTIDQLIYEYHILRQVIFDVLEEEVVVTALEREIIISAVEQAVNDAATQFSNSLSEFQDNLNHTIAHDVRNLISSVGIFGQLMLRLSHDSAKVEMTAKKIIANTNRINLMLRDLLDSSRFQAGHAMILHTEENDLELIAKEFVDEFKTVYGDFFQLESSGPIIGYWCKNSLLRLLENLGTNALKYHAPNSQITVTIQKNQNTVTIKVHNTGTVISPEEQKNLFQSSYHRQNFKRKEGWGFGLIVVKSIVEAHHGKIYVESSDEAGTSFIVELPIDAR